VRRYGAISVVATCTVLALATSTGWFAAAHAAEPPSWTPPTSLVSPGHKTFSPELAVSGDGEAIAGWYAAPFPKESLSRNETGDSPSSHETGAKVVVDLGTVAGGFGPPLVVSHRGTAVEGQLQVAVSGAHVAYAAWMELPNYRWVDATVSHSRVSASRPLIPGGAQLIALTDAQQGPVAVVWDAKSGDHLTLKYGLLNASGRLGRSATITPVRSDDTYAQVSVNDHGQLAAAWVRGDQDAGGKPKVMVAVCRSVKSCSPPQTLALGQTQPEYVNLATTISTNGTVRVLAAGHDLSSGGNDVQMGLWGAVGSSDGEFGGMELISATGDFPVAVADGPAGALAVFNVGPEAGIGLAWSLSAGPNTPFSQPTSVSAPNTLYPAALAANLGGQFVVAWAHSDIDNPSLQSIRAATGTASHLGQPEVVLPAPDQVDGPLFTVGIDRNGDAILLWNEFRRHGAYGMFTSVHRDGSGAVQP
jgi:hypothetical protein